VNRLFTACPARLVWVSTAPLGRPVVPDVLRISAGESLGMSICGGVVSDSTNSAS